MCLARNVWFSHDGEWQLSPGPLIQNCAWCWWSVTCQQSPSRKRQLLQLKFFAYPHLSSQTFSSIRGKELKYAVLIEAGQLSSCQEWWRGSNLRWITQPYCQWKVSHRWIVSFFQALLFKRMTIGEDIVLMDVRWGEEEEGKCGSQSGRKIDQERVYCYIPSRSSRSVYI